MNRLIAISTLTAFAALQLTGCNTCGRQPHPAPTQPPGPYLPGPPAPAPVGPTGPGGQWLPEPPATPAPIGPVPSQSRSIDPQAYGSDSGWKPSAGSEQAPSVRLYPPEVDEQQTDTPRAIPLGPPEPIRGESRRPTIDEKSETREPPVASKEPPTGKPVGIPQYSVVRPGLSAGLRPSLDDGLDWLKQNGYKTVVYIHEPGEPESADRKQVEKRGMKFIGLAISAPTLTKQMADEFSRIVADSEEGPIFVYDRDGALQGSLWYLHFRMAQQIADSSALEQARALGLNQERGGNARAMFEAAKRVLNEGF